MRGGKKIVVLRGGVNFKICSRRGRVRGGVRVKVSVRGWIMVMDRSRIRT